MDNRYSIVSDGNEYTVYDSKIGSDLFPTSTGNRYYACKLGCSEETAIKIAKALNTTSFDYVAEVLSESLALHAEVKKLKEYTKRLEDERATLIFNTACIMSGASVSKKPRVCKCGGKKVWRRPRYGCCYWLCKSCRTRTAMVKK